MRNNIYKHNKLQMKISVSLTNANTIKIESKKEE